MLSSGLLLSACLTSFFSEAFASPLRLDTRQAITEPSSGLQIFLDFDGTIATSDAYSTLAYAAYDSLPPNSSITSWDEIESVYGEVYDAASANISLPTNLTSAIGYSNNAVLHAVESWSFVYVQETGLFNTVRTEQLYKYAQNVKLRDGWCSFANTAQQRGIQINVVSLTWSPSWVRLILEEASGCRNVTTNVTVYCSEILPPGALPVNERNHDVPLRTGGDKTILISQILANLTNSQNQTVVFASDGSADLQPLWESPTNVGLVAGYDGSAYETFSEYGVNVLNASAGWKGYTGPQAGGNGSIYAFESFVELETLLWG